MSDKFFYNGKKKYKVLAMFPDTKLGTHLANNFMDFYMAACVIAVVDGWIVLVSKYDQGEDFDLEAIQKLAVTPHVGSMQ